MNLRDDRWLNYVVKSVMYGCVPCLLLISCDYNEELEGEDKTTDVKATLPSERRGSMNDFAVVGLVNADKVDFPELKSWIIIDSINYTSEINEPCYVITQISRGENNIKSSLPAKVQKTDRNSGNQASLNITLEKDFSMEEFRDN